MGFDPARQESRRASDQLDIIDCTVVRAKRGKFCLFFMPDSGV